MWRFCEKVAIYMQGRELLLGTKSSGTLTLDLPASRNVRNLFLRHKPPSLRYYMMAVWADSAKKPRHMLCTQWVYIPADPPVSLGTRNVYSGQWSLAFAPKVIIIFIILGSKQTCPLLWSKTLSVSSRAVLCTNILPKNVWYKRAVLPRSQLLQKCQHSKQSCHDYTLWLGSPVVFYL